MKKGTLFELIIKNIEESIKELDTIQIAHDVDVSDELGIKRQIDVLLTIDRGKRFGVDHIIIECKDENSKSDIGDIDAFINKVNSIPTCNLGIFVNKKGYSKNTIKKAGNARNIRLFVMSELHEKSILGFETVKAGGFKFKQNGYHLEIQTNRKDVDLNEVASGRLFNHTKDKYWITIEAFALEKMKSDTNLLINFLSRTSAECIQNGNDKSEGILSFEIDFDNFYHLETFNNKELKVSRIKYGLEVELFPIESKTSSYLDYLEINSSADASTQIIEFPNSFFQVVRNLKDDTERYFSIDKSNPILVKEIFRL